MHSRLKSGVSRWRTRSFRKMIPSTSPFFLPVTGYISYKSCSIVFFTCFLSISRSSQMISFRCVIMELTFRSPRMKTRSTMSCSTSCTSPPSFPSCTIDLISSSVTLLSESFMPSRLNMQEVLFDSSHTNGAATSDKIYIGRATTLEAFSAILKPILLGTSSPNIRVR